MQCALVLLLITLVFCNITFENILTFQLLFTVLWNCGSSKLSSDEVSEESVCSIGRDD